MKIKTFLNIFIFPIVLLFSALTHSAYAQTQTAPTTKPINVVASFSILADIVQQVGGKYVQVHSLIPIDGDPHAYEAKPSDAKLIKQANLVFINGLGLDNWVLRLAHAANQHHIITVSDHIQARNFHSIHPHDEHHHADEHKHEHHHADEHNHADGHKHEHHHHGRDPHAWQDIANVRIYVQAIRDALIQADPSHQSQYIEQANTYDQKLSHLDQEMQQAYHAIPEKDRVLVTSHDAFSYYAARYHITIKAITTSTTDSEPSAANLSRLIDQIRQSHAKVLFTENITDPRLIKRIAAETGAVLGPQLYSDALSDANGPAATYLDMMRYNFNTIISALKSVNSPTKP